MPEIANFRKHVFLKNCINRKDLLISTDTSTWCPVKENQMFP